MGIEDNGDFLKRAALQAEGDYIFKKTAEECMELALALMQAVNKPDKDYSTKIAEELSHVMIRVMQVTELIDMDKVQKEFEAKIAQMKRWEKEKGFKNL